MVCMCSYELIAEVSLARAYIGKVLQYLLISFLALKMFLESLMHCGALFQSLAAFLAKDSLAAVELASWFQVLIEVGLRTL